MQTGQQDELSKNTGGLRRHEFVRSLDTGQLMGVPDFTKRFTNRDIVVLGFLWSERLQNSLFDLFTNLLLRIGCGAFGYFNSYYRHKPIPFGLLQLLVAHRTRVSTALCFLPHSLPIIADFAV